LVTDSKIEGGTDEEWLGVYSKLMDSFLLSYDQYKEIVTPAFLEMTGYTSEAHFQERMNKIRADPSSSKPAELSILSAVNLTCKNGEFVIITEYNGHLMKADSPVIENEKGMTLLRKIDGKWKQEDLRDEFGLDLIPWKNLEELKALAKCSKAIVSDGKLRAQ